MAEPNKYKLATLAIHGGFEGDPTTGSCQVPIYPTSSYLFENTEHAADLFALKQFGNIYSRLQNPTCDVLEKRLAALDGGVGAVSFASGMAAISAVVFTLARQGQNFVTSGALYGGTTTLFSQTLKNFGIEARTFDPYEPQAVEELIDDHTRFVYTETIGNPNNAIPDFRQLADIAHKHDIPLVVDNTVTTPALFRPLEAGADIVVYSTTKFLGGHGAHVGGAVVDGGTFDWAAAAEKWPQFTEPDPAYHGMVFTEALKDIGNIALSAHIRTHWLRDTGAAMSPFAAWVFLIGLETLHVRMARHAENALAVAQWLDEHRYVTWVNYPGLENHWSYKRGRQYMPAGQGAIIGFGIKGGRDAGIKFINSVKLARHLANIGDAKTLVIHPASTTHQQLSESEQHAAGVSPEFIRLSVGIEDLEDIRADLDQALTKSQK